MASMNVATNAIVQKRDREFRNARDARSKIAIAHLAADHLAPYAERLGAVRAVAAKNDVTNTAQS
jgi:hypothetical protein